MTGAELSSIREALGLSASAMGKALGYSGPKANIAVHIRRLGAEILCKPVGLQQAGGAKINLTTAVKEKLAFWIAAPGSSGE